MWLFHFTFSSLCSCELILFCPLSQVNYINVCEVLNVQGELALAFGELLRKLWSAGRTAVAPRAFKGKLARFAPQFSGYNQHDSQVFIS